MFLQHLSWTKEIGQQPPSPSNISYVVKQTTGKCYPLAKYQVHLLFSLSTEPYVTDNLFRDRYRFIFLTTLLSTSQQEILKIIAYFTFQNVNYFSKCKLHMSVVIHELFYLV